DHAAPGVEEGNVVDEAAHHAVADVPVGVAVISLPVIWIHWRAAVIGVGRDVESVRPGVAGKKLKMTGHVLAEYGAQALVGGHHVILHRAYLGERLIRTA